MSTRRALSVICMTAGLSIVAWGLVTWVWQEPFTALHQALDQRTLERQLSERRVARGGAVAIEAGRYRRVSQDGEAMGRIEIPQIALDEVLVDGTTPADLAKGPGIYRGDDLPGQRGLVYIAGHRTTHGAPFSHLDRLRVDDAITIVMPYGVFRYRVTGHRIVPATDLRVLESGDRPELILQTCWPRFSASHRYLVYARPIRVRAHAQLVALRTGDSKLAEEEASFTSAIARVRALYGLPRLSLDDRLIAAARRHSNAMLDGGYFAHRDWWREIERYGITGDAGQILGWRSVTDGSVRVLLRMWLASPEHRRILLDGRYRSVGVGVAVGAFKGFPHALVVTVDFLAADKGGT